MIKIKQIKTIQYSKNYYVIILDKYGICYSKSIKDSEYKKLSEKKFKQIETLKIKYKYDVIFALTEDGNVFLYDLKLNTEKMLYTCDKKIVKMLVDNNEEVNYLITVDCNIVEWKYNWFNKSEETIYMDCKGFILNPKCIYRKTKNKVFILLENNSLYTYTNFSGENIINNRNDILLLICIRSYIFAVNLKKQLILLDKEEITYLEPEMEYICNYGRRCIFKNTKTNKYTNYELKKNYLHFYESKYLLLATKLNIYGEEKIIIDSKNCYHYYIMLEEHMEEFMFYADMIYKHKNMNRKIVNKIIFDNHMNIFILNSGKIILKRRLENNRFYIYNLNSVKYIVIKRLIDICAKCIVLNIRKISIKHLPKDLKKLIFISI